MTHLVQAGVEADGGAGEGKEKGEGREGHSQKTVFPKLAFDFLRDHKNLILPVLNTYFLLLLSLM